MHWKNSRFQVVYFLVGKKHTPDEAYRLLQELKEERVTAYANVKASDLRTRAKVLKAQRIIDSPESDEVAVLEAQADIAEVDAFKDQGQACIDEAQREIEFLDMLIAKIEPHRKYAGYADHEAYQLTQQEEWKYELMTRVENYLATSGQIPADHYASMRNHPEFETAIAPYIQRVMVAIGSQKKMEQLAYPMTEVMNELVCDRQVIQYTNPIAMKALDNATMDSPDSLDSPDTNAPTSNVLKIR